MSDFDLFFMWQLHPTSPEKKSRSSFPATPSKSWGPTKHPPPLLKIWLEAQPPRSCRKGEGRGCTLWNFVEILKRSIIKAGLNVSFLLSSLLKDMHNSCFLTLYAPISQNGQTHWNNSSANCQRIVGVCLTILWDWHLKG